MKRWYEVRTEGPAAVLPFPGAVLPVTWGASAESGRGRGISIAG